MALARQSGQEKVSDEVQANRPQMGMQSSLIQNTAVGHQNVFRLWVRA